MTDKKTETKTTATPTEPAADEKRLDETQPGGHYVTSEGMHVDAEGNELTKTGKPKAPAE